MRTVYVIPHAEATHHVDGLVGGWLDTPLTQHGQLQAQAAATAIQNLVAEPTSVYASDLTRAVQTAQPIVDALGSELITTPDLREIGCGIAEGKPQAWLDARIAPPPQDASRLDHVIIEGAETRRSIAQRINRFVEHLTLDEVPNGVVVTHGFAASFVLAAWIGMPANAMGLVSFDVSAGGITRLDWDPQWGNRQITTLDDTTHLADI